MDEAENSLPFSYFGMPAVPHHRPSDASFGLPKQFVKSMRTLFDMLDDNKCDQVALTEIERRWRDDAVPNLPGVLDALRAIAPMNGMLTFENFVKGLRLALHRARMKNALKSSNNLQSHTGFQRKLSSPYPLGSGNRHTTHETLPQNARNILSNGPSVFIRTEDARITRNEENNYLKGKRRLRHRRSNSGPIFTAKVLPNMNEYADYTGPLTYDDSRIETTRKWQSMERNGGYLEMRTYDRIIPSQSGTNCNYQKAATQSFMDQTNFDARAVTTSNKVLPNAAFRGQKYEPPQEEPLSNDKQSSNFDQITASTLFVNQDAGDDDDVPMVSVQPVVLSGKYIGVTGTVKRSKSSACISQRRYGSLQRPICKTAAASSSLNSLSPSQFLNAHQSENRAEKEQENNSWKSEVAESSQRKRAVPGRADSIRALPNQQQFDNGQGRRCDSASPPDVPAEKSARRIVPNLSASLESSTSSAMSAISDEDVGVSGRRLRGNSTSSAQRRRNARWNTAVVNFDSPMIKQLKKIQQKENLLRKGLDSVERLKQCLHVALGNVKRERDHLNEKVEGSAKTPSGSGAVGDFDKLIVVGPSVSTAMENLEDIVRQFQKLETGTETASLDSEPAETSVSQLQEDNSRLMNEVSEKQEMINQLEKEKAALVRQLFLARSELQQCEDNRTNTSIFI